MSVLQVYLSWANSVLCEANSSVDNVSEVQDGKVLCEIIDILDPDAGLMAKVQASGTITQRAYIQTALDHMKSHDIQLTFSAQDVIDGDIKSLLDIMWLLILNYGIHFIGHSSGQRGVGVGKKSLVEWCQTELEVAFDPKNSLTYSLCTGNWFTKLLQKFAGLHVDETEDKVSMLQKLLVDIDERYGIRNGIINPSDIVDGTVDDHTLMIYLSLLKRRVCSTARRREMYSVEGKQAALEKAQDRTRSASEESQTRKRHSELVSLTQRLHLQQQLHPVRPSRSASMDSALTLPSGKRAAKSKSHGLMESGWLSSDTSSILSGRDKSPGERGNFLLSEAEQVLRQTISERVKEHMPTSARDEDKDTDVSQVNTSRETESLSEGLSGAMDEGYVTNRKESAKIRAAAAKEKDRNREQTAVRKTVGKEPKVTGAKKSVEQSTDGTDVEKNSKIRIKRPKDYYLQWEETIDRLSQGPPDPPDVSDMSPRSPRQILRGIEDVHSPRSRSGSSESDAPFTPVWKRKDFFERRAESLSPSRNAEVLGYSVRSSSLPLATSLPQSRRPGEIKESPSPGRTDKSRAKGGTQVKKPGLAGKFKAETHEETSDSEVRAETQQAALQNELQDFSLSDVDSSSQFMERLEELKRSGRAQRVILPDLGPDAPVLMIPGQGEEVLLLFDALRQARLEVDQNMTKVNGATTGTGETSDVAGGPPQSSSDTELKKVAKADKGAKSTSGKSSEQAESNYLSGRLPRPTIHRHRFSKPTHNRLADLRSGTEQRRTRSLVEKRVVSPLVNAKAESTRYHSLSPHRHHSSIFSVDTMPQSAADRNDIVLRDVNRNRIESSAHASVRPSVYTSGRDSTHTRFQSPYGSSLAEFTASQSSSPFRRPTHQASYQSSSPALSRTSERLPPLELPEDLVSPRPKKVGGLGRVPRREAWERQRQGNEPKPFSSNGTDSNAQAKFIEILCKEIEELKHKIEVMEDSQAESSPERTSPMRGRQTPVTGETSTVYSSRSAIQETENKMLLASGGESSSFWQHSRSSPSHSHASPRVRSTFASLSPTRHPTDRVRGRQSPSPDRHRADGLSPGRKVNVDSPTSPQYSSLSDENVHTTQTESSGGQVSPSRSGRAISLGYKSPIRSVTQEIWGKDLSSVEGLEPHRQENYKRLISQTTLSEEDVIELKQSLASAVVENDILQAKLNNAKQEIQEKLSKTNEVLDDCRRHLAKSQAENMELRTALEREKGRTEASEGRVRDLQQIVKQVKRDNEELEEELENTLSILDRSRPGIDALKQQNIELHGKASAIQNENSTLKREMDELRQSHFKSVNTIRELRGLLDEVREERKDLQHQLSMAERAQSEAKLKSILSHYNQEKGAKDETECEYSSSGVSSSSERFRHSSLSSTRNEEVPPVRPASPTITPRSSSPRRGHDYSFEELPSTYREIYPHRKPRYQNMSTDRQFSSEDRSSPMPLTDYPDLERYPTKLDHVDPDDPYLPANRGGDDYCKAHSRDTSPVTKSSLYQSYQGSQSHIYTSILSDKTIDSAPDSRVRSPQARGRSPVRLSQRFRESRSSSSSPVRDILNRSYESAVFECRKRRSASSSPGRFRDARKGILKNWTTVLHSRDRSSSPRYSARSYSPPTRLSPELGNHDITREKKMSSTSKTCEMARKIQQEFDKENLILDGLRKKHCNKSWFELQLEDPDSSSGAELPEVVGEEHLLLSEEQRSYANELIKKYTGLKL